MNYEFPIITSINEVYDAIRGKDEFISKHDSINNWIIFNYNVNFESTFPPVTDKSTAILRECRGLTFHGNGNIASRKWHKFFNINERRETFVENSDFSQPHVVLEKEDGSMITPVWSTGQNKIVWCTKMGDTDISIYVEAFVAKNKQYAAIAEYCIKNDQTALFEFCSRKNRVVIDHPTDRLVLLGVRDNITGKYMEY